MLDRDGLVPRPAHPAAPVHVDADGERLAAAGDFMGCAQFYVDAFNREEADPRAPARLLAAAACYEQARRIGAAVGLRRSLTERFPRTPQAAQAALATADAYAGIAYFDEAAAAYERYAAAYAERDDAPAALATAA
ncbi:MAG TPA: hypothetical protein VL172_10225, partial [Kofleriaceae bacterium]|nr:hypothetical protein [Kofleriaceae bacterium]